MEVKSMAELSENGEVKYSKDLKKEVKLIDAVFPANIRPHFKHQIAIVPIEANEKNLNSLCKNCGYCSKSKFTRQANELGAKGFMHTLEDGLVPKKLNKRAGIELRVPITKIILKGERFICHCAEAGARGAYIVGKTTPQCKKEWQIPKEEIRSD